MATKLKVLIADDRFEVRDALRLVLSQTSSLDVVGEAEDLPSALEAMSTYSPDVLLLDWELPGRGERMTVTELRSRYPKMVFVAMSSDSSVRSEALLAGVDAFVSKAEPLESLWAVMSRLEPKRGRIDGGR